MHGHRLITSHRIGRTGGGLADYSWYNSTDTELTISDAGDLLGFANIVNGTDGKTADTFVGKTVKLGADVDLSGIENWTPIGKLDASADFKGEFDGDGKTISNLTMTLGDQGENKVRAGLFASLSAKVSNLTLENVNISANGTNVRAGALGGNIWDQAIVSNVTIDGFTFKGSGELYVGGLGGIFRDEGPTGMGKLKDITVKNVNITASGDVAVGGVSGFNSGYFNVDNVDAENVIIDVTATNTSDESCVGGFFGGDSVTGAYDFKDCDVRNAKITLEGSGAVYAGGFGGYAAGGNCWTTPGIDSCTTKGVITNNNTNTDCKFGGYYGRAAGGNRTYENVIADVDIVSDVGVVGGF